MKTYEMKDLGYQRTPCELGYHVEVGDVAWREERPTPGTESAGVKGLQASSIVDTPAERTSGPGRTRAMQRLFLTRRCPCSRGLRGRSRTGGAG